MNDFLPFSRPAIGDEEIWAVENVLRSGWITTGPQNHQLEEDFRHKFGCQHAIAFCSATAGMHITLMALGIGTGDEVITPSLTWVSTINMITLLGAHPVMIDVDRDTLMVQPDVVEQAITPKTKAIIPVHYAGAPCDLDALREIAQRNNIALIEDAAHAVGTRYQNEWIGQQGTAIFSFHAIKNITCAEGGLVATDDDALATRLRCLKFHGLGVDAFDRQIQGRKPQAEVVEPGFKYNLSDIHAAIAVVQLKKLAQINKRRAELVAYYRQALSKLPLKMLDVPDYPHLHANHLFMVRVDETICGINRDSFMERLKEKNIGTGLHFRAAHTQKYYREHYPSLSLPNSEWNSATLCSLPLFPDMRAQDVDRVVAVINEIFFGAEIVSFQSDVEEIKKVSIVIPIYNEEQSLPQLLERTLAACQRLKQPYELILVDDGSADNSANLLIDAAENSANHIIAVILNRNYGQHSAIMAGFKQATGDLVITLDADLQNPPEEIPNLVQVAEQGYDVVGTRRMNRQDSWFRKTASKIINAMITKATGRTMGDYGCMLRAYRRNIINAMLQCHERSTFIPILANTFARRTIEIDVAHAEREFGDSKYSFMKLINLMFDLLTCLTTTPLRLLSVVGSFIAASGFLLAVLLIILRLIFGAMWAAEGVFTLFAILFIFIGAQFIAMGLLGEYIGRMYNDVRARPRYFIQKIVGIHQDTDENQEKK